MDATVLEYVYSIYHIQCLLMVDLYAADRSGQDVADFAIERT